MVLGRAVAAAAALVWISAAAAACGGGLSKADADLRCDQEKAALATACFDDSAYASCESCMMECGDACVRQGTACPAVYKCAGESASSSSSSGQ